jgi:hypothetical protein
MLQVRYAVQPCSHERSGCTRPSLACHTQPAGQQTSQKPLCSYIMQCSHAAAKEAAVHILCSSVSYTACRKAYMYSWCTCHHCTQLVWLVKCQGLMISAAQIRKLS